MIITRTPMRISIGGGGTDLPSYYSKFGGWLISAAIDKYMFINVNRPIVDDLIRVKYSKSEIVNDFSEVQHDLVREALRMLNLPNAVEITSMADIPAGTGLGSSSCFMVGILNGLHTLKREYVPLQTLAEEACHIEIDVIGKPIGKQDQYLAAFGGITVLDIDREGNVTVEPAAVSDETVRELESNILIFFTGIKREATDILSEQSKATTRDEKKTVESLHRIKEIGREIYDALKRGEIRRFGELLHVHWETKKNLSGKITSPRVNGWYEVARAHGALGGKIMGAGGGGFFMFYCEENQRALRAAMRKEGLRELHFRFDMEGTKVLVNF